MGYFKIMTTPPSKFAPATVIRDQLYDRIPMSAPELALVSTSAFQRLERIQQLGFASRIWPGARHTRFEHSLGVLYLARRAIAQVQQGPITDADRAFIAASLLHDIGHYPFSHAIEELGAPVRPHEEVGRDLITRGEVADILRNEWALNPAAVAALIDPKGAGPGPPDPVRAALLSGPLDIDKLDYLPRDARACGVPYGGVDTERLLSSLKVISIEDTQRLVISEKGISPTHSLINARQEMFDNVYWHHTNRACMVMLLRAVQEAILTEQIDPDELARVDDFTMLALLQRDDMPPVTRSLCQGLIDRRIHKRALEISSRSGTLFESVSRLFDDASTRRLVERELAERVTGDPDDGSILIDIPKPEKWRTDLLVWFDRPPVGFDNLMTWQDVAGMTDDDLRRYESHRRLIRIVVRRDLVDRSVDWRALLDKVLESLPA
jgi:HD superfamily phosphohydrolase